MKQSFRHPGIIAGGGIALLGVAQGLLGALTGVYLLDSRWSRLYILGEEARRRGLIQALLSLAVLLIAGLLGIWLK
ncbi:MAG: hypothetical protein RMK65_02105 [Anaerolineae bacterium]|nr:hypothetical protein [Anaerolineae bacterium]MCX8067436.1 hypothetical protein [Anaerolineae bacterium]MDW7990937.1 hypothetical protein [Anaerolineae bacterium]